MINLRTPILWFSPALLSMTVSGCGVTDPDLSSLGLEGIWRSTVTNESETTIQFHHDGSLEIVEADFFAESCTTGTGRWSLDGNLLIANTSVDGVSEASKTEVESIGGGTLRFTSDGESEVFVPLTEMSRCIDYGWGSWQGTLSAVVSGANESFASNLIVVTDLTDGFGDFNIISYTQGPDNCLDPACVPTGPRFLLDVKGPAAVDGAGMPTGTYDVDGSPGPGRFFIGKYWPDPEDNNSGFEAFELIAGSSGAFELTEIARDRIAGTFSFIGVSVAGGSRSVTQGLVDLTYR